MAASEVEHDPLGLERGDPVTLLPDAAEIQRAIASVPGVTSATVRRDQHSGRTRLRVKLKPGEDAEQAAWSVAATLRERFGIALDPADIRPVLQPGAADEANRTPTAGSSAPPVERSDRPAPPPAPTPPSVTAGTPRAVTPGATTADPGTAVTPTVAIPRATIARLDIERGEQDVEVTVVLRHGPRTAAGVARATPTARSVLRAAAEATAASLQQLTIATLLIAVDRVDVEPTADPAYALVALTVVADRGEEELVGVSLLRGEPERAVVRATLDACNRRVGPLLSDPPPAPPVPAG